MGLLAGTNYDPGTAVTKSTASLLAMTALDTTNLRLTFTAPASGNVLVRLRGNVMGATSFPRIFLGVLDGATIKLRGSPMGGHAQALATTLTSQEVVGVVTGLTPSQSYTWDAAYGVEVVIASTNLVYGGPNDASGADAQGGFVFEVWAAANMLAAASYDPTTAATKATTSLLAMTALDTTNLRLTFTAPASGNVFWRLHTQHHGSSTLGQPLLGILESTTVVARVAPLQTQGPDTFSATSAVPLEASGVVTGVSAGSHTWDAAYAVQVVSGAGGLKHGGADDTTTNNAFGATFFSVWSA